MRSLTLSTLVLVYHRLPDRPFHLQLDQPIHLDRVLHRQFLDHRLDEAGDDHGAGLVLGQAAALEVEELLLADLADRRLVADGDVVLVDLDVRVGVRAALFVQQQRVADHVGLGAVRALGDLQQAAIAGPAAVLADRLGDELARRVRRRMHQLAAGVQVLAPAGKRHRQDLAVRAFAQHVDRRILHRDLGTQVGVHPLHRRALVDQRPLGHQVVDVGRPVLDGRVAAARALADDDLDHAGVQRVLGVARRRAALRHNVCWRLRRR